MAARWIVGAGNCAWRKLPSALHAQLGEILVAVFLLDRLAALARDFVVIFLAERFFQGFAASATDLGEMFKATSF